jgi:nitroreductase
MKVSDAVSSRSSVRAFTKQEVDTDLIRELLQKSSRSASGGNLQPWRIFVLNGESMDDFLSFQSDWSLPEIPSYEIYPKKLKEPYRTSRYQLGEQMYEALGIAREDKQGRLEQVMKNFNFFGAPAALFCFVDRQMGPPQWSDLGMFLQTFMLLAKEAGLDTCAQEAWSMKHDSVSQFLAASDNELLFCGVALGYKDEQAKINQFQSDRRPLSEWTKFI